MIKRLLTGLCMLLPVLLYSQDFSNKGKEFWLGYGNHQQMYTDNTQGMAVYITSDVNTNALVEIPGVGFSRQVAVTAFQISTVTIPNTAILDKEGKVNKGIHVTADKAVVVYAHIYFASVSGATLCLPVATLGRQYYSVNFTQVAQANVAANSFSYFFVTATEDNTTIEITPSANTQGGRPANVPFTDVLNKGEIYQVLSATDLTGSVIRSINNGAGCKRIAVFCGSGRIGIGCPNGNNGVSSSDNLYQQMYPNATWGKKYITVPSATRPRNYYRVVSANPALANLRVNGVTIAPAAFTNGFYYEFENTTTNLIESDAPVLVAQYFTTQQCGENTNNGDPEMIFLNPVEQTINDVTLTSMRLINTGSNAHYINMVVKNVPGALNTMKLDGVAIGGSFVALPQDPGYAYLQVQVVLGTHRIVCDSGFNAIAYGFATTESYGYSAGTNLRDLYQYVSVHNQYATVNYPAGCRNSPLKFSMTFPYQPAQIRWVFNGLLPDTTIMNPVFDSTWIVNGRTLYRYKLNKTCKITASGTYPIKVIAINPTADGCSGEQDIDYDLQIFDPPAAAFSFSSNGCITSPVSFKDETNSPPPGRITNWYWNFGDGQTGSSKNPSHSYTAGGSFAVKFNVFTDVGCISDTISKPITISEPPLAKFVLEGAACDKKTTTFIDQSTVAAGTTISTWSWDFGDGTALTAGNNNPVQHIYNAPGAYTVNLQLHTISGCSSPLLTQPVVVNLNPVAAFIAPDICLNDPVAQFYDNSTIGGSMQPQFSYLWDFGDGSGSLQKNGQHKFAAAGVYHVKLSVTSQAGCAKDTAMLFTVNGSMPIANFNIDNTTPLCSNKEIRVTDAASVDFGKIIRVEIYWDYLNDPAIKTVDSLPARGKSYAHLYPASGTEVNKQIRYVVYSGITCLNQFSRMITLQASPEIQFDAIQAVCEETEPFKINTAHEIHNLAGTGVYSGNGIDAKGIFNPHTAAAGLQTISYHFTAADGCTTQKTQTILVNPTPMADAGPDKYLLEGGSVIIGNKSSGNGLSYVWTPGSFLDNATIATPTVTTTQDIFYTLLVTSAAGCKASDKVTVKVLKQIKVPNAFSPNGDGINDTWVIQYLESYPDCTIDVYNRYGQVVYHSAGYTRPWDGRMNGQPLPFGVYYWIINPMHGRNQMNGSVTILR